MSVDIANKRVGDRERWDGAMVAKRIGQGAIRNCVSSGERDCYYAFKRLRARIAIHTARVK